MNFLVSMQANVAYMSNEIVQMVTVKLQLLPLIFGYSVLQYSVAFLSVSHLLTI